MSEVNLEQTVAPEPNGQPDSGIWSVNTERLRNGELSVAGVPLTRIARKYGTPTFVLDSHDARGRARTWKQEMDEAFAPTRGLAGAAVYYASKAFLSKQFARWMVADGLHLDVASLGELQTALAAGVPAQLCGLHGNNKSRAEIELALREGIGHIVIDSLAELDFVAQIAAQLGVTAPVYLRLTTGVHAGGHEFIATAHEDQKFGLSITAGVAREAIKRAHAAAHLELRGLHSHIGSQIAAVEGFQKAARIVLAQRAWAAEQGIVIGEIDLGGGYAVRYTSADPVPPAPRVFARALAAVVKEHLLATGLPAPLVAIEPGRAIVAPAMLMLYEVGTVKDVATDSGPRRYVAVDGGMSDNIRTALYGAQYTATLANRAPSGGQASAGASEPGGVTASAHTRSEASPAMRLDAHPVRTRVVGKHCESGDIVVHDVALDASVQRGDLLAVPAVGAYGYAMASNYNMIPRPGVVAVADGLVTELIRRETVADLLARDLG